MDFYENTALFKCITKCDQVKYLRRSSLKKHNYVQKNINGTNLYINGTEIVINGTILNIESHKIT